MSFIRRGNRYTVFDRNADPAEKLPAATYLVKYNELGGVFELETMSDFTLPGRIYGNVSSIAERILKVFHDRDRSTGIALHGEKGSGKTLVSKLLSIRLRAEGLPTLVVSESHCGENFNQFIQDIDQPAVVLFDEFEKVYDGEDQEKLLTLLDGMFPSRKLFVLTTNDGQRLDCHMNNRPGRLYYNIDFKGVDPSVVDEYCGLNLRNQKETAGLKQIIGLFENFNFDMLQAVVEEMNRFNEPATEAVRFLNVKPETSDYGHFNATLEVAGKTASLVDDAVYTNPLHASRISVVYYKDKGKTTKVDVDFTLDHLRHINGEKGEYVYVNGDKVLTLQSPQTKRFGWDTHAHVVHAGPLR